jgi:hypothetical protein
MTKWIIKWRRIRREEREVGEGGHCRDGTA